MKNQDHSSSLVGQGDTTERVESSSSATRLTRHDIVCEKPAVRVLEAGLLGNGAMGVIVRTRPDAILLHFGHNAVWDRRVAEVPMSVIGTFEEFWQQWQAREQGDEAARQWTDEYAKKTKAGYDEPYPRPWPCGTLIIGFDRRKLELLGHRVRLADGVCEVQLMAVDGTQVRCEVFPDARADRLWISFDDNAPVDRVEWSPEPCATMEAGADASRLFFRQTLPCGAHALRMTVWVSGSFDAETVQGVAAAIRENGQAAKLVEENPNALGLKILPVLPNVRWSGPVRMCVQLEHGPDSLIGHGPGEPPEPTGHALGEALAATQKHWATFWGRSAVYLEDQALERAWYRSLYFHACSAKADGVQPGLYGPWVADKFGLAWHGDYHMNYNAQQVVWGLFSSNQVDLHLPYVRMVRDWLPCHQRYTRAFYNLPGAAYTLSLYPFLTSTPPIPSPPWNMQMCVPSWVVQSLWWQYLYTGDEAFLRDLAFEPIKQVVLFLNAYMRRPDSPWQDGQFHIHPSFVPEMDQEFGFSSDPKYNDCLVDLTLAKFLFNAFLQSCAILKLETIEAGLITDTREVLAKFPAYVITDHPAGGRVYRDVAGSSPETIYNTPNPIMHVFPGEEIGLHSPAEQLETARRTWQLHRNEGGNELVFHAVQGARLGILDLEKWKRQLRYCELPNGPFTDMILQVGGRYAEGCAFHWMDSMGIWSENFAVPFVVNECLLQSYNRELRFFPNWPEEQGAARFENLRAAGAFLVSAAFQNGIVQNVTIMSEKGHDCVVVNPWPGAVVQVAHANGEEAQFTGERVRFKTQSGETVSLHPL